MRAVSLKALGAGTVAFALVGGWARDAAPTVAVAPSAKETFSVDSVHSKALFRVQHLGAGPFWGRFNEVSGTIAFDSASDAGPDLNVSVAVGSVDTGTEKLDGHLKSPDFFNVKEHPNLTFKSKSSRKVKDRVYEVTGDLTIHGVTKPLTTQVEWTGTAEKAMGKRCGFEAVFTIKRADFGMNYMLENGGLGEDVKVIVALEGLMGG